MTKQEILKEIGNTRFRSRLAMYEKNYEESAMLDRVTDKLVREAEQEMNIDWIEIAEALEDAAWWAEEAHETKE